MSARTTIITIRLVKTSCIVGLTVVLLALLTSNHSHAYTYGRKDFIPDYDHDTRDYYLIRAQSPHQHHHHHKQGAGPDDYAWTLHEDQQRGMGDLLGLRFEAAVGQLPDYFLYSAPKRFVDGQLSSASQPTRKERGGGLTKRSTISPKFGDSTLLSTSSIDAGPESELEEAESTDAIAEPDPVVKRFHALKREYIERLEMSVPAGGAGKGGVVSLWEAKRNDLQADIVQAMETIERQELRQRNKKRVPLPDFNSSVQQPSPAGEAQGGGGGREAKSPVRRGGGENRPMRPSSSEQEQEEIENAAEDEEVAEEEQEEQRQGGQTASDDEGGEEQEGESSEQDEGSGETQEEEEGEEEWDPEDDPKAEYQPAGEEQPEDGFAQKFDIDDPGFRYQWHLHNTKDKHDINVTGVWEQGINGTGVNVAIIDDGLDLTSEDLAPNFFKEGSWDFNDRTALPMPRLIDDQHGTRCAGEIAAAKNDLCGLGVAYGAKVAGLRILSGQITDVDEAAALNYRFQDNHIYSCSWGPPDDGQSMDAPKGVVLDAMKNGIKNGRSGLGSIFVFATGNGGSQGDDCNFDGYTNSLYTVSIGAIDRTGRHPYYSEACSAQLAVTYSNGGGSAIYTCDVGERRCYDQHGGTSAAAPIAAGMIALVLSVRPDLSWRDVQYLLMTTAIPVSVDDEDWQKTAAGRMFNHKFGYGSLDAYALVEAAKSFQSLGPQTSFHPVAIPVGRKIPQNAKGVVSVLKVAQEDLLAEGVRLGTLEHITVTVNIEHGRRGDVEVVLTSPNNVESKLGVRRRYDAATTGFSNWTFMTVKHWDENPVGEWKLTVRDQSNPDFSGKFVDWRIQFWGETKREVANIKAKPLTTSTGDEDEQLLSELQPDGESHSIKPADMTEDVGGEEKEKEKEPTSQPVQPPADTSNSESKVIVDKDPTIPKLGNKDNESLPATALHEIVDPAQAESSVFEPDPEEQVASTVSRTLYAFVGVIGVGGLIAGYLTRHKWDGRGQYASIRGGGGGGGGGSGAGDLDRNFVNDDDDIDLLPRGLRPGRSDSSLTDCEDDDDIVGGDRETRQQQQ
ncbi:pheromone processing endoprotease [Linnemannia schmuckeri]|uniref:Pheromone processing endoprotease n=1 Tax=Linnemannia schmuckeri TaxID=64567 RepID=A0A9P5RZF2_9FUNG|nr:pheromone processing endoprotease [Linnemannia schmuckeri]